MTERLFYCENCGGKIKLLAGDLNGTEVSIWVHVESRISGFEDEPFPVYSV